MNPREWPSMRIQALRRDAPELGPWLDLVEIAIDAAQTPSTPRKLLERLLVRASKAPGEGARSLRVAAASKLLHAERVIDAAVRQDRPLLEDLAAAMDASPAAFVPVAELAAFPLLQERRRRDAARCEGWSEGHCPICGAWPALAELRGLDRATRLRCGRCGADWGGLPLRCPFCKNGDHLRLTSLVPESGGDSRRVEACEVCHGYLKVIARLTPIPPELVIVEDVATVDLDMAAIDRGYRRPEPFR